MILKVLEDFQAAPGSSRPARSIGDVKFNIRIDYNLIEAPLGGVPPPPLVLADLLQELLF